MQVQCTWLCRKRTRIDAEHDSDLALTICMVHKFFIVRAVFLILIAVVGLGGWA